MNDDQKIIDSVLKVGKEQGTKIAHAPIGSTKRFYCARCDCFTQERVSMYVPRHGCGRQLRTAFKDDFVGVPDKKE